jgi:hypothetical protein
LSHSTVRARGHDVTLVEKRRRVDRDEVGGASSTAMTAASSRGETSVVIAPIGRYAGSIAPAPKPLPMMGRCVAVIP